MAHTPALIIGRAAVLALLLPLSHLSAQASYGTEAQAKAMLDRAVVAMKENKTKALAEFNKGEKSGPSTRRSKDRIAAWASTRSDAVAVVASFGVA